jgi:hypothetical protein
MEKLTMENGTPDYLGVMRVHFDEVKTQQSMRISDVVKQSLLEEIDRLLDLAGPGLEYRHLTPDYRDNADGQQIELSRCEDATVKRITLLKGQTTEMALRATIHWLHGFITAKQQYGCSHD